MVLAAENLGKSYTRGDETVVALEGASFRIEAGSFCALVGPSGSGKSTVLNLIAGFATPDDGRLSSDGNDLGKFSPGEWDRFRATTLGFVFQQFNLIPVLSAVENVELVMYLSNLSASARRERALTVLRSVGLAERLAHRPDQLSGGQQQRVAIARAIVNQPRLVLADEPTANLDGHTAMELIELMHDLCRTAGTTFLFATHDTRIIQRSDVRLDLEDGRLVNQP